ncbi:MarR family winged helix-turn-helix transcriptional regulator [Naasia lichenicola]|uniref:Winged helix-turn-helix transcriptional regulator n=1 Tax=Naasia lichenicola TaxID=2565933 RepID=A0A4S4FP69_9MICO|nr:MarR family winged helix-turn-helix transcriptional regulator [Naasia lichenicola]THG32343.1 winged helix-turn-helix transcriptional regulator [Naasia lichenicola]
MSDSQPISDADRQVWRSFLMMRRQLDRALEQRLQGDAGVSGADFEILTTLQASQDKQLRARELTELLGWEKSRVSHQVTRMEARGLVERKDCPTDLRGTWVALTAAGTAAVLTASLGHDDELRRRFFGVLDLDEKSTIGAASERIIDAVNPTACERADEILGESVTDAPARIAS